MHERDASDRDSEPSHTGPGVEDPDARRMLALRAGDESAFDDLFRRWSGPLLRYLERMVVERAIAEELVQEAFLRVHRARERYDAQAKFSTWLYRIATNLALNELRRPHRRSPHASRDEASEAGIELLSQPPDAAERAEARQLGGRVEDQLDRLPERQRMALWLSAVEGMSYAEVGEALEASESSVKALVHRARATLVARVHGGVHGSVEGVDGGERRKKPAPTEVES